MDKYLEVFCKQNPKIPLECGNEKCKFKFEVKTADLCKKKKYIRICEKCGKTTEYNCEKMFNDIVKKLKSLGIKVK